MKTWALVTIGAMLPALSAGTAFAHHSFKADFDLDQSVHLEGSVVEFEWVNPHSWINIDARVGGRIERWRIQGGPPSALRRRGWSRDSLPVGTKIIVDAFRARDGSNSAGAQEVLFSDGRKMSLGNPAADSVIGY